MGETIWPVSLSGWIALVSSVSVIAYAACKVVTIFALRISRVESKLEEIARDYRAYLNGVEVRMNDLERRAHAIEVGAKRKTIRPGETISLHQFGKAEPLRMEIGSMRSGAYWHSADIPAAPVQAPDESAPQPEEEESDADRVARHEVELAEWDLSFTESLLKQRSDRKEA